MTCYLVNWSPSTFIEKKTVQEVWFGSYSDYSDIKIFYCATYAGVDSKFELISVKCIFLGFVSKV